MLEAESAGFGASGRNGGWCSALFPASADKLAAPARASSRDAALAQHRAMRATVDEVGAVAAAEGIDAHFAKGGTIVLARTRGAAGAGPAARSTHARAWGRGEDDLRLLDAGRGRARCCGATGTRRRDVHPRLRGRAPGAAGRAGWPTPSSGAACRIHERTRVRPIEPGRVRHRRTATVRAATVVRATEGYTAEPGRAAPRDVVPVYSLIVATEPLPADDVGARSGWPGARRSATTGT